MAKRSALITRTKGAMKGLGRSRQALTPDEYRGYFEARSAELKARLKRAQTPTARPKGRLPNSTRTATEVRSPTKTSTWAKTEGNITVTGGAGAGATTKVVVRKNPERTPQQIRTYFDAIQADNRWQLALDRAGVDRYSRAARQGVFAKLYHAKVKADEAMHKATKAARVSNGLFDGITPKRVQKIRPVKDRDTGERGEIIGSQPGGWVKVKWADRAKPTLIKRTEIKRGRYPNVGVVRNPGPLDIVYGLQAYDYISKRKIKNPAKRRRYSGPVIAPKAVIIWEYPDGSQQRIPVNNTAAAKKIIAHLKREVGGKRVKKNPSVTEISEKFQGRASGSVRSLKAANSAPNDLARIGKLVLLRIEGMGRDLKIPGAVVAASPSEKLWIAGTRAPMLNRKAAPGQLLDFGPIKKIVYLTAKTHIGDGQTFEYDHDFESPLPHLCVDHEGMPVIRGGGYTIKSGGITG